MARPRPNSLVVLVALGSLAACAHARTTAAPPREQVVWPAAPEAPRVRLARVAPEPAPTGTTKRSWRRVLDAIIGLEHAEDTTRPLERPFGVTLDQAGEVVIADPDVPAVARLGRDGILRRLECAADAWVAPMAITALPGGALLVADAGAARLVRIDPDGRCSAFGPEEFERPTGVAVGEGRVYVADPPRHTVVVLDASGTVLARIGTHGEGDGALSFPTAVATAPGGDVLVVDALNFRIARFAPDGRWIGAFGSPGDAGGAFARPKGIAVGGDGRIYVSDAQRDLVLVFHPDGAFDYAIGESGSTPGRFAHPAGLASAGATLYVADSHNARIQGFDVLAGGGS